MLIKKDDWAAFKSDRSRRKPGDSEEVIKKKNSDFDKELSNISLDDRDVVYRYRILCNDLASYGIGESDYEMLLRENEELKSEDKTYRKDIVNQKFLYRQYARLEEINMREEQKRADEKSEAEKRKKRNIRNNGWSLVDD